VGLSVSQQLYTRNQFAAFQEKLISLNYVSSDKTISLRQVSPAVSKIGGQGLLRWLCKKKKVTQEHMVNKIGGFVINTK